MRHRPDGGSALDGAVALLIVTGWIVACSNGAPPADRRSPNEVRASDFGEAWPLTVESGVLACHGPGSNATITTPDGTEYALNGTAKSSGRFRPVEPIWKLRGDLAPVTEVVERLPEEKRRAVFKNVVGCEDEATKAAMADGLPIQAEIERERVLSDQCKADLRRRERLTAKELSTISGEGVAKTWHPLTPTRVNIGPLIDAAVKLCG